MKPTYEELENELRGMVAQAGLYERLSEQLRAKLSATPPATPAPEASGEAGEREKAGRVAEIQQAHTRARQESMPFWTYDDDTEAVGYLLARLTGARVGQEDALQYAAGLQEQLHEARQEAARLQQELAEARAGGWVPVGERLPEVNPDEPRFSVDVLWYIGDGAAVPVVGYYDYREREECAYNGAVLDGSPTHWMPAPPAPAQTPPAAAEPGEGREV